MEKAQAKDKVHFNLDTILAYDIKEMMKPYPYVLETAEKLSIYHQSKTTGTKEITYFDLPIQVNLKLKETMSYQTNTYKTYTYDYKKGDWISFNHMVQTKEESTYLNYRQDSTGLYAAYRVDTYHEIKDINYAMKALLANYNIKGLGTTYTEKDSVHSKQFINLMLGFAQGYRDINLDGYLSDELIKKANITKIYVKNPSGYITQEEALSGVVRLYEMKTGYRVKPSTKAFQGVSTQYKENIGKAHALGLMESLSPQKTISYGELCTYIQMILPN